MKRNKARTGFTLIELMVVVIILAALAAMIIPHVMPASDEAKKKIAATEIASLKTAIRMFNLHNSRYPTTAEGLEILTKPAAQWNNEPYVEDTKDPWGRPFKYVCPGAHGTPFDVSSFGPDGKEGTIDDIVSWKQ